MKKLAVICGIILATFFISAIHAEIGTMTGPGTVQVGMTGVTGDCSASGPGSVAITCTKTNSVAFGGGATGTLGVNKITLTAVISATSTTLPANAVIVGLTVKNTTANAITGGLKIGTTAGGTDIVVALTVGANSTVGVAPGALLKNWFSDSATQSIFIDTVTLWNSASININIIYAL